jgi:hypothetical protein
VTVVLGRRDTGELNPVVVPARVSVCVEPNAFEKLHQDPEVADESAGNVIVLDGPAVKRKVVPTTFDDAVRSTVVPDTLEVAYR